MADKIKHSNDEIFDLLSAMAVDIEEIKNRAETSNPQSERLEKAFKSQVNTLLTLKKTIDSFPSEANKYFIETKEYHEKRDEDWRNDMKDFTDHLKKNNDKYYRHNGCIVKMFMELKDIFGRPNPDQNIGKSIKSYPFIIPKGFKNWLKFLFYDCPKYSFSKPIRRKFLNDLGRIIRLLISIIVIVLIFLLANDNHHLRREYNLLKRIEMQCLYSSEKNKNKSIYSLLSITFP